MEKLVGVYKTPGEAYHAVATLRTAGIADENLSLLMPGELEKINQAAQAGETGQTGAGVVLGGALGGAVGAAGGLTLGTTAASLLIPGVGPVIAFGLLGGVILGSVGALGGALAGGAIEESALNENLPAENWFLYEDALRRGYDVLIVQPTNDEQAKAAHNVLEQTNAETLDAARDRWWAGVKETDQEPNYRRGFEAAQDLRTRGRSYDQAAAYLAARHPDAYRDEHFRRGYEQGRAHHLQGTGDRG